MKDGPAYGFLLTDMSDQPRHFFRLDILYRFFIYQYEFVHKETMLERFKCKRNAKACGIHTFEVWLFSNLIEVEEPSTDSLLSKLQIFVRVAHTLTPLA